jgi:hypothetical protein
MRTIVLPAKRQRGRLELTQLRPLLVKMLLMEDILPRNSSGVLI